MASRGRGKDKFSFEVDHTDFNKRMKIWEFWVIENLEKDLGIIGNDLLKEAGKLAPKDTGRLIRSGRSKVKREKEYIEAEVGFNKAYATRVHYEMTPAPGAVMKPGERTAKKPSTEFGEAGGLYLQRPLLGKWKRYYRRIANTIRSIR